MSKSLFLWLCLYFFAGGTKLRWSNKSKNWFFLFIVVGTWNRKTRINNQRMKSPPISIFGGGQSVSRSMRSSMWSLPGGKIKESNIQEKRISDISPQQNGNAWPTATKQERKGVEIWPSLLLLLLLPPTGQIKAFRRFATSEFTGN